MLRIIRYVAAISLLACGALAWSGPAYAQGNGLPQGMLDTVWELVAIQRAGQAPQSTEGLGITLQFHADNNAGGESVCNVYGAEYRAGGGQTLTFEPIIATLRACVEEDRQDLETEYFAALQNVTSYDFAGNRMQLSFGGQNALIYAASGTSLPGMPRTGAGADVMGAGQAVLLAALGMLALSGGLAVRSAMRHRRGRA